MRELCAGTAARVAPVVKANAYGHGLRLCAGRFAELGADLLCVNELAEVAALADIPVPVYVLGPTRAADAEAIAELGCHVVTMDRAHADAIAAAASRRGTEVPLHVKIETGTNRQGLLPAAASALMDHIRQAQGVRLAGVCTHLADVEDETEHTFAQVQLDRFDAATAGLPAGTLRHAASSAALILLPRSRLDMVRPGIAAYGLWPSENTRIACGIVHGPAVQLRPALAWKTEIVALRAARVGDYVGYGRTLRLGRDSRVAVLPVGYYDGYDRLLSGRGEVLVRGRRAPVAGRVCMNMTMIDVTRVPGVQVGDEVVLLGVQGEEEVTAEALGAHTATINYEVTTRIHERLPRLAVA